MKVFPERLGERLDKGLDRVYLVAGPETLLVLEACDAVRTTCRDRGVDERIVLEADTGFDWNDLGASTETGSLFASRRLIDLRLPSGKPGREGGQALREWVEAGSDDILMLSCRKWELASEKTAWFKALDTAGVYVPAWSIKPDRLPAWIGQRLKSRGLEVSADGARFLAARLEGNLLAAAQVVDRLALLYGHGALDRATLEAAVADQARYDAFRLVELVLNGDAAGALRCCRGLQAEAVAPPAIVAALARELQIVMRVAARPGNAEAVFRDQHVWSARQGPIRNAVERLEGERLRGLPGALSRLDRLSKGQAAGSFEQALERFVVGLCAPRPLREWVA